MRKIKSKWAAVLAVAFVLCVCAVVFAGTVYDREWKTITSGSATWTNTRPYAAVQLTRIFVYGSTAAANTITVTRVTSGTVSTQAVGSVVVAANVGNTASFTAGYMKYGDTLVFSSGKASNATAIIEFHVQQH